MGQEDFLDRDMSDQEMNLAERMMEAEEPDHDSHDEL